MTSQYLDQLQTCYSSNLSIIHQFTKQSFMSTRINRSQQKIQKRIVFILDNLLKYMFQASQSLNKCFQSMQHIGQLLKKQVHQLNDTINNQISHQNALNVLSYQRDFNQVEKNVKQQMISLCKQYFTQCDFVSLDNQKKIDFLLKMTFHIVKDLDNCEINLKLLEKISNLYSYHYEIQLINLHKLFRCRINSKEFLKNKFQTKKQTQKKFSSIFEKQRQLVKRLHGLSSKNKHQKIQTNKLCIRQSNVQQGIRSIVPQNSFRSKRSQSNKFPKSSRTIALGNIQNSNFQIIAPTQQNQTKSARKIQLEIESRQNLAIKKSDKEYRDEFPSIQQLVDDRMNIIPKHKQNQKDYEQQGQNKVQNVQNSLQQNYLEQISKQPFFNRKFVPLGPQEPFKVAGKLRKTGVPNLQRSHELAILKIRQHRH